MSKCIANGGLSQASQADSFDRHSHSPSGPLFTAEFSRVPLSLMNKTLLKNTGQLQHSMPPSYHLGISLKIHRLNPTFHGDGFRRWGLDGGTSVPQGWGPVGLESVPSSGAKRPELSFLLPCEATEERSHLWSRARLLTGQCVELHLFSLQNCHAPNFYF